MKLDRSTLRARYPRLYFWLRSARYALRPERPDPATRRWVETLCGMEPRVVWGPFAGLRYGYFASGSGLLPKIAGTYEMELHGAVMESIARLPSRVVNVGCGEGYYAAGYARALSSCAVYAFDRDPLARQRARRLARLNGVGDRVHVGGHLSNAVLARLGGRGTLLVSDCEGCERDLLEPASVPCLVETDLLVECHDFLVPGTTELLTARFSASHTILSLPATARTAVPAHLAGLSEADRARITDEGRPPGMRWLWMRSTVER